MSLPQCRLVTRCWLFITPPVFCCWSSPLRRFFFLLLILFRGSSVFSCVWFSFPVLRSPVLASAGSSWSLVAAGFGAPCRWCWRHCSPPRPRPTSPVRPSVRPSARPRLLRLPAWVFARFGGCDVWMASAVAVASWFLSRIAMSALFVLLAFFRVRSVLVVPSFAHVLFSFQIFLLRSACVVAGLAINPVQGFRA
jgi:hypothetical protein